MKSIERRFNSIQEMNPLWSSLICFSEAICGQGFSRESINRRFSLVDKEDYDKKDKVKIVNNIERLSKLEIKPTKRKI